MVSKTSLHCLELLVVGDSNRDPQENDRFEYAALPSEQRAAIQQLTTEIKADLQKTVRTIWDIGKKLAEVRAQIETCYFTSWLKTEFNWSRRTAYNFINVYEAFPEFSRAKFARLDISVSALYLLAAPSTQPQIRSYFRDLALAGDNISYQAVRASISTFRETQAGKDRSTNYQILAEDRCKDSVPIEFMPSMPADPLLDLAAAQADVENSDLEVITEESASSDLRPGWNSIEPKFSLFWGNTTSPRFIQRLPEDAFVLAVPSCRWHHDWLLNESRSCINLTRSKLNKELVTRLLSALALGKKAIIFPWLPNWKTVELALQLDLKVYAGEPDLDKCEQTIAKLGFKLTRS